MAEEKIVPKSLKTKAMTVRLTEEQWVLLRKLMEKRQQSQSGVIRYLLLRETRNNNVNGNDAHE